MSIYFLIEFKNTCDQKFMKIQKLQVSIQNLLVIKKGAIDIEMCAVFLVFVLLHLIAVITRSAD